MNRNTILYTCFILPLLAFILAFAVTQSAQAQPPTPSPDPYDVPTYEVPTTLLDGTQGTVTVDEDFPLKLVECVEAALSDVQGVLLCRDDDGNVVPFYFPIEQSV